MKMGPPPSAAPAGIALVLIAGLMNIAAAGTGGGRLMWEDAISLGSFETELQDMVVSDGKLFAVGVGPFQHSPSSNSDIVVKAYDPKTGTVSWSKREGDPFLNDTSAGITASGGAVFVAGSTGRYPEGSRLFIRAYDAATGVTMWEDSCGAAGSFSLSRSVTAVGERVYLAGECDAVGFIRAYDPQSGVRLWQSDIGSVQALWPAGSRLFALGVQDHGPVIVRALDVATGDVVWETRVAGSEGLDSPVLHITARSGAVFAAYGEAAGARHRLQAFDPASGVSLWARDTEDVVGAIASDGTRLFAGSRGATFLARAYDARTGALLWQRPPDGYQVDGIQVAGNALVVAGSGEGLRVQALDPTVGSLLWQDRLTSNRGAGGGSIASHGGSVFVGGWRGNLVPPFSTTNYLVRAYDVR